MIAEAAELHAYGGGGGVLWPCTALELAAEYLPALARRHGQGGLTVRRLRNSQRWEVTATAAFPVTPST